MSPKSLPHQISANERWSKEDPAEQGRILRAGLERKFLDQVDPDRALPETARRVRQARSLPADGARVSEGPARSEVDHPADRRGGGVRPPGDGRSRPPAKVSGSRNDIDHD